jgi:hypothetical protein
MGYPEGQPTIFDLPLDPKKMHERRMKTEFIPDIKWSLTLKKVSDLKEHPNNPRKLTDAQYTQIKQSLEKFGIVEKPVINTDGIIIGGHQRLKILRNLGIKTIECWIPSRLLTSSEVNELNIRLNKNCGDWDWDILANQWEVTDLITWGFSLEELQLNEIEEITAIDEEENETLSPGKDEEAITKLGDVYELNEHRIVCGDSTLPEYVEKCLNGAEPILMATDPPYGVEYDPSCAMQLEKVAVLREKFKMMTKLIGR